MGKIIQIIHSVFFISQEHTEYFSTMDMCVYRHKQGFNLYVLYWVKDPILLPFLFIYSSHLYVPVPI